MIILGEGDRPIVLMRSAPVVVTILVVRKHEMEVPVVRDDGDRVRVVPPVEREGQRG